MATRSTIEAQIADDIARDDLPSQISAAVDTAIRAYEEQRFYFNEAYRITATLSSSAMSIALASISPKLCEMDRVRVLIGGIDMYDLYKRDYAWIMARQDIITFAPPSEYCIYGEAVQFDCGADTAYPIIFDGVKLLGSSASDSYSANDTSAWFNAARELIRNRAKREVYMHVTKDPDGAATAKMAEDDAFNTLMTKTNQRASTGLIRPDVF